MKQKTFLLDLDGTMYAGRRVIDGAPAFIRQLHEKKIPYLFLTNNAMRTPEENAGFMRDLGFDFIEPYMFYNSAMAAAAWAAGTGKKKTYFMIGQKGLEQALKQQGFVFDDKHPSFVFVGLDKQADYALYSKALQLLLDGAVLVGTNKDKILAAPGGFEMGNGSIVKMFEHASGQVSPQIGKPAAWMLESCLQHFHLKKEQVVLVGDNLETDIALGYNSGIETVFVESGVHTRKDLEQSKIQCSAAASLQEIVPESFLW